MNNSMMDWYTESKEEVLKSFNTRKTGFTKKEAEAALKKYGQNILKEKEKKSIFQIFLSQFADLLVIILLIAAVISMLTGEIESTLVIIVVLILNAVLGTVQHVKAEQSLDSLKSLSTPMAKVIRDGKKIQIDSKYVVPGDIIALEAGDMVVADGRIIDNYSLQVNESSLTGESANVDKKDVQIYEQTPLADRVNMVYSGSLVTYGRANVAITSTAMDTELGKIAALMNETAEKKTPLQRSLDNFSKWLATGILVICIVVFAAEMINGMKLMDALLFAVALAVAAIPEALSSIVTIVQAMGTQKMAREHAIIKNLSAVEALGCVSVICSDKTGTLTQNKMTVQDIYDMSDNNEPDKLLLYNAVLNNDSEISKDGNGIGDPTEYALLFMYRDKCMGNENELRNKYNRLEEVAFDSDRKLMSSKYNIDGKNIVFTKGALDVLLDRCVNININGSVRPINDKDKENILGKNIELSKRGLRVLSFAYKYSDEILTIDTECNYTFSGIISMIDPPRKESVEAVAKAKKAGIKTVMITGDHKITASAIASQIGIFEDGDMAVTGMELDKMSDEELEYNIDKITVYARVSPENKIRIVDAWQKRGAIVSMTGDGVNDAPALKKADIGVAMGITGTEVSKDASSMILSDDNFATIIKAVANGRTIYQNIKNAVLFLLSGNLSAIITVLYASLLALPVPFKAVQLLFINLVTDSLPALAIGMEPQEDNILEKAPRNPKEGIMDKNFITKLVIQGILISLSVIAAYTIGLGNSDDEIMACSMAFITLTLARLFHGSNCRGEYSIVKSGFKNNWYSLGAFIIGVVLVALVIFVPFMRELFFVHVMSLKDCVIVSGLAALPTVIIQLYKMAKKK